MRIRNEQLDQMGHSRVEDFERRLIAHLRKHHPEELSKYSDEDVRAYVQECRARAKNLYGIESEQGIACYSQLAFLLGDTFEIDPTCTTIPVLLGRRSFEQNTRAKMALAFAYQIRAMRRESKI